MSTVNANEYANTHPGVSLNDAIVFKIYIKADNISNSINISLSGCNPDQEVFSNGEKVDSLSTLSIIPNQVNYVVVNNSSKSGWRDFTEDFTFGNLTFVISYQDRNKLSEKEVNLKWKVIPVESDGLMTNVESYKIRFDSEYKDPIKVYISSIDEFSAIYNNDKKLESNYPLLELTPGNWNVVRLVYANSRSSIGASLSKENKIITIRGNITSELFRSDVVNKNYFYIPFTIDEYSNDDDYHNLMLPNSRNVLFYSNYSVTIQFGSENEEYEELFDNCNIIYSNVQGCDDKAYFQIPINNQLKNLCYKMMQQTGDKRQKFNFNFSIDASLKNSTELSPSYRIRVGRPDTFIPTSELSTRCLPLEYEDLILPQIQLGKTWNIENGDSNVVPHPNVYFRLFKTIDPKKIFNIDEDSDSVEYDYYYKIINAPIILPNTSNTIFWSNMVLQEIKGTLDEYNYSTSTNTLYYFALECDELGNITPPAGYKVSYKRTPDGNIEVTNSGKTPAVKLSAKKTFENKQPEQRRYSFVLTDENDNVLQTVENDSDGNIDFVEIPYYNKDLGKTFIYKIKEVVGNDSKTQYDNSVYTVEVTPTADPYYIDDEGNKKSYDPRFDNSHISIKKVIKKDGKEVKAIEFNNTTKPSIPTPTIPTGSLELTGLKTVNDETPDKSYTFSLLDSRGQILQTKQSDLNGNIKFDPIRYDSGDIGTEYTYTVVEQGGTDADTTYDTSKYTVKVKPYQDPDDMSKIIATPTITKNGKKVTAITFNNKVKKPVWRGNLNLSGKKLLNNKASKKAFKFQLKDENGNVLQTIKNDKTGRLNFNDIAYREADAGKTFKYTVTEVDTGENGITYDDAVYTINVKVEKSDQEGILKVEKEILKDGTEASGIVFKNTSKVNPPKDKTDKPSKPKTPKKPTKHITKKVVEKKHVVQTTVKKASPKTGDSASPITWTIVLAVAVVAGAYTALHRRKR